MRKTILTISIFNLLCLFVQTTLAQSENSQSEPSHLRHKNYPALSFNYQNGKTIPLTDFIKGDNLLGKPIEQYQSYSLRMLWQNPGYKDWQRVYHIPYYGMGLSLGDFFNPLELGYPVSAYGILGIPIFRLQKLELYSEFQFGMAWNWQHYDSLSNPKNFVIGGGITVHLNIGLAAYYPVSNKLDLGFGINFVHFSNGGFERPNRGINIYDASLELKYHLTGRPDTRSVEPPKRLERSNDLFIMLGYGDYQIVEHELDTNYFAFAGISTIYHTQFTNAFRLGYGADLNYWWGLNVKSDGTHGPYSFDNLTLGFILQPEFIIDKLTLVGGIGIYARHLNYGNFKQTYQRLGVRYEFYDHISFGINVRAINFTFAEVLEFNLGYRFRSIK